MAQGIPSREGSERGQIDSERGKDEQTGDFVVITEQGQ